MDYDEIDIVTNNARKAYDPAIEESGLLGTRRGWSNINRYEILFLILGALAAMATDGITIFRLTKIANIEDSDFVYGILILVNSIFLLLFLVTGILQQRITDIVAFFISAIMLTIYVIAHFVIRKNGNDDSHGTDATTRLIRLICAVVFNVCFVPLTVYVIQDYRRDEFSKRLFGAFPAARRPLKVYNIFDCIARINTMLSISTFLLNLYNFNVLLPVDKILLCIGIPLTFLWLGFGIGMVRLENRMLFGIFCLISLFQPAFLIYCLYSAIDEPSTSSSTSTVLSTITSSSMFSSSTTPWPPTTTTPTTTSTTLSTSYSSGMTTVTLSPSTTSASHINSVPIALYVCVGANMLTHILSIVFGVFCIRNFGKGLKERVFNNRADKLIRKYWSKT